MNADINIGLFSQGSEEWHEARRGRLTATGIDNVITPKTFKPSSKLDSFIYYLIGESLCPEDCEPAELNTYAVQRGCKLEPVARETFSKEMDLPVCQVGFLSSSVYPYGCSPDGLIGESPRKSEAGLEIKCPLSKTYIEFATYINETKKVPDRYILQVHGSMAITGLRTWYFYVFHPRFKHICLKVSWNEVTDAVQNAIRLFCDRYNDLYNKTIPLISKSKTNDSKLQLIS